jgi:hypothetical protein
MIFGTYKDDIASRWLNVRVFVDKMNSRNHGNFREAVAMPDLSGGVFGEYPNVRRLRPNDSAHFYPLSHSYKHRQDYLDSQRLRGMSMSTLAAYEMFLQRFIMELGKPTLEASTRDVRFFLMEE